MGTSNSTIKKGSKKIDLINAEKNGNIQECVMFFFFGKNWPKKSKISKHATPPKDLPSTITEILAFPSLN